MYIEPSFFFSYYGFEWVKPLGIYTYILFIICGISALFILLGFKYRVSSVIFFLSFTYIELMDKTTYLNHYYFVSVVSFMLIFLPAHHYFSVDAMRNKMLSSPVVPSWTIDAIKLMITLVYFYAGLAKLNSDWLLDAMPLKIWLPSKVDTPFIGNLMAKEWVQYAFSWIGAIYDLLIPFFLWFGNRKWIAFTVVVVFHMLTWVLFPIGIFPYVMICSTLIYFSAEFHEKIIDRLTKLLKITPHSSAPVILQKRSSGTIAQVIVGLVLFIQLLVPFRYLAYPGELFWTEEGYRFSWRVMLMEKTGYAQFKIVNKETGKWFYVNNTDFLTSFQEKQMSFQPDFIVEYAHFLKKHFESQGHRPIGVFVDSHVALNGRLSQPFIDPTIDLSTIKDSFSSKKWILPFNDEIKGL
ncbi:HTTM domain-containing protein [Gangjinia marincola]|uniref:HTTM domain-containing protein n=2 Tax=Gangjinia marincola TaxID=578463 RepID=A0ABP3XUH6_9FLAO